MDTKSLLSTAKGVTCDSRQVLPGYIFVAINGRAADGNLFAAEAVHKGALAIVSDQPEHLPPLAIPVVKVPDARIALAELATEFHGHPSNDLALVGVTGSNGKTTVTFMLDHIFRYAGLTSGLIGTVHVNLGNTILPSILTTPDATSLQHYLATMRDNGVTHVAMEVSAQGMELRRVHGARFSCGVLTNICPDHLDFHGDFDSYVSAKAMFTDLLGSSAPLIVNRDDPQVLHIARQHSGPVLTAGFSPGSNIVASDISLSGLNSCFKLSLTRPLPTLNDQVCGPVSVPVILPLPGRHNIENATLAAVAAMLHGVPPVVVARALSNFSGVVRRMDVYQRGGIMIVDDTALNPGSIDAVFQTISAFRYRRLIVVNAIRGRRGSAINATNATALARWWQKKSFKFIVTASTDHVGTADEVAADEKSAFLQALKDNSVDFSYADTLSGAITEAIDFASPGDLMLLLGAQGMDDGYELLVEKLTTNYRTLPLACSEAVGSLV